MITYWYQIDSWNGHMKSMGWTISEKAWDKEENRWKRKKLSSIFSQRNFFQYERRLRYYEELRDGIFSI